MLTTRILATARRKVGPAFAAACALVTGAIAVPALGAQATPAFAVLAFYSGTYDAAHIDFDKEALTWFPQLAAQYGFSWEATTDWNRLNSITPSQYQVVMFLDDVPPANTHAAFRPASGTRGPTTCARTRTSTSSPRWTPAPSR